MYKSPELWAMLMAWSAELRSAGGFVVIRGLLSRLL